MQELLKIVGKSLAWGLGAGIFFLVVESLIMQFLGGPVSELGPVFNAFVAGLGAFVIGLFLALLCQGRRAVTLPNWGRAVYGLILTLVLVPALFSTTFVWSLVVGHANFPNREERMKFSPPLTEAERQLLRATHLDLTVAVRNQRYPPAYTQGLIWDLDATGLFEHVGRESDTPAANLIATVEGMYWGNRTGVGFALASADNPEKSINIKVYYWSGGSSSGPVDRSQYLDRLAVEVIRAVNELEGQDP